MTDMSEAVAVAIAWAVGENPTDPLMPEIAAKAAIQAHEAALKAEGLVIVPREPTDEMGKASALIYSCKCGRRITQWGTNAWQAMLAALEVKE